MSPIARMNLDVIASEIPEVSKWVLELDDNIIKNTIMHELIHCMPYCNRTYEFVYTNEKVDPIYDISI